MRTLPASRPLRDANWSWVFRRTAVVLVLGVLIAYAVLGSWAVASNWYFYDAQGYWEAGLRLRSGGELYPPLADQDHPSVYRYAPWFAWAWAALTFLPRDAVLFAWGAVLATAAVWLLLQIPRSAAGLVLALIFAPMLLRVLSQGNVHVLMVAMLVWGISRRSGPFWIAVGASLKVVPILFAALYIARREYARAGLAVLMTLLLWSPALLVGLEDYPAAVGGEAFPFGWFTFVIAGCALAALVVVPVRYRALAASLAVTFASPRWIPYNPSYLFVGVPKDPDPGEREG